LDPKRLEQKTNESIRDKPKIITCSLDNTIRLWDSKKMDVINLLQSPDDAELSCMTFLPNCCLVATGHEDGSLRLWNLEISSDVVLKSQKGGNHTNSISCITSDKFKESEFLIAGSYDGTVSIWDISQKASVAKGESSSTQTTIYPQFRNSIDNAKFTQFDSMESSEVLSVHFFCSER
jgi:WD40 repeat protein